MLANTVLYHCFIVAWLFYFITAWRHCASLLIYRCLTILRYHSLRTLCFIIDLSLFDYSTLLLFDCTANTALSLTWTIVVLLYGILRLLRRFFRFKIMPLKNYRCDLAYIYQCSNLQKCRLSNIRVTGGKWPICSYLAFMLLQTEEFHMRFKSI